MLIYKDIITGDEMFSDTYRIKDDGTVIEVEGKIVTEKISVDGSLLGSNPAEGGGEGGDDGDEGGIDDTSVSGCNIVLANRLQKTSFNKKSYMVYAKEYMKKLKVTLEEQKKKPEEIAAFQSAAQAFVKRVSENFDKFDFYTGESVNPEGMVALLDFKEDGVTPYMLFFKPGLACEKV